MELPWALLHRVAVVATLLLGVAVALALDESDVADRLRGRLLLGVPWGTLVTVGVVLAVYLFVQGGLTHWNRPLVLPFRAWSYLYPLGIIASGFSHASPGHLLGNLFGTLALAPLVEYAWGHYPRERGVNAFASWRTNPYVRAFVLFPLTVVAVGVLLSAVILGPVIGFSGVVFAFAGFALVRFPLGTVVALAASNALSLVRRALVDPVSTAGGRSVYITPWWSDIAIQGHAVGLVVGIVLGVAVVNARDDEHPDAARLWAGVLLFSVLQSLWAVYWYRGGTEFVLYRAVGTSLVALLATLVTLGIAADDEPLLDLSRRRTAAASVRSDGGAGRVTARQVGFAVLVVVAVLLAAPAVPLNLVAAGGDVPGETVSVEGYEVTYAENVTDGMVSVVPVSVFGETTAVRTSGVIVRNEHRALWTTVVSRGSLAFSGRERVVLGGVGWRHEVLAVRDGWTAAGGDTAYRVRLVDGDERRTVFTSPAATADPVVAGRNVSVAVADSGFQVVVDSGEAVARAPMPAENESVTLLGVTLTREGDRVVATHDGTRITVLEKERYKR